MAPQRSTFEVSYRLMFKKHTLPVWLLIAMTCAGYGCPSVGLFDTYVRATIDGVAYFTGYDRYREASIKNGVLEVTGDVVPSRGSGFYVVLATVASRGTEMIRSGGLASCEVRVPGGVIWKATGSAGSGSVTITSLNETSVAGTFNCRAEPFSGGATGTKVVTDGAFRLQF